MLILFLLICIFLDFLTLIFNNYLDDTGNIYLFWKILPSLLVQNPQKVKVKIFKYICISRFLDSMKIILNRVCFKFVKIFLHMIIANCFKTFWQSITFCVSLPPETLIQEIFSRKNSYLFCKKKGCIVMLETIGFVKKYEE